MVEGHVARMEMLINSCRILVGEQGKKPFGIRRRSWGDNILKFQVAACCIVTPSSPWGCMVHWNVGIPHQEQGVRTQKTATRFCMAANIWSLAVLE